MSFTLLFTYQIILVWKHSSVCVFDFFLMLVAYLLVCNSWNYLVLIFIWWNYLVNFGTIVWCWKINWKI